MAENTTCEVQRPLEERSVKPCTMEDDEREELPELTLQQELNEIMEEFYDMVSEEVLGDYQKHLDSLSEESLAEKAIKAPEFAPDFDLIDQDGDKVHLKELLKKGPVVLSFYRGKWCPHCSAQIMQLSRHIEAIQAKGATLVCISPMLPDGTQYMATKHSLQFHVVSDVGNKVAKQFNICFTMPSYMQGHLKKWGIDIPETNGDETYELPLPATYIVNQTGQIIWSFIDNDPNTRAETPDIVASIPTGKACSKKLSQGMNTNSKHRRSSDYVCDCTGNQRKEKSGRKSIKKRLSRLLFLGSTRDSGSSTATETSSSSSVHYNSPLA